MKEKRIRKSIFGYRQEINYMSSLIMRKDLKDWEKKLYQNEIKRCKHEIKCWQILLDNLSNPA